MGERMKVKITLSKIIDTDEDDIWGIEEFLSDMTFIDYDCLKELFEEDILSLIEDMVWDITIVDEVEVLGQFRR